MKKSLRLIITSIKSWLCLSRTLFRLLALAGIALTGCSMFLPQPVPTNVAQTPTIRRMATALPTKVNFTQMPTIESTLTPSFPLRLTQQKMLEIKSAHFAYAPNGQFIVIGYRDASVLFDITTGKQLAEIKKPPATLAGTNVITFSPDGSLIAAGGLEETIYVWEWPAAQLVQEIDFHDVVLDLEFSPDGNLLAAASAGENPHATIWSTKTWEEAGSLKASVTDLGFSPSQPLLASAELVVTKEAEYAVRLWNINTYQADGLFKLSSTSNQSYIGSATAVAFSGDGKLLAAIVNDQLRIWDMRAQEEIEWPLSNLTSPLIRAIFSSRGDLATLDQFGTVTLLNPLTGQILSATQIEGVRAVAFSPDGTHLLTGGSDINLQVWRVP